MIQIIPAVLATSEEQYQAGLAKVERSEVLKNGWMHVDFADGIFVPNKTIGPSEIAKYPTYLKKEAHLMIQHPKQAVDELEKLKFERVIMHLELSDNLMDGLHSLKDHGIESGLAIKYGTDIESLVPYLGELDVVLVMSVVPGFQGQPFIPEAFDNVKKLVTIRENKSLSFKIGMDGGMTNANIKQAVEAGIDYAIMGSYLMKAEDIDEQMETVWEAVNG